MGNAKRKQQQKRKKQQKRKEQQKTKEQLSSSELVGFIGVDEWLTRHAGAVFPTRSSFDWFVKRHRREMVEAGALIPREGRSGSLVSTEKCSPTVIRILKRCALEKTTGPDRAAA